jgi:hypothetical protein
MIDTFRGGLSSFIEAVTTEAIFRSCEKRRSRALPTSGAVQLGMMGPLPAGTLTLSVMLVTDTAIDALVRTARDRAGTRWAHHSLPRHGTRSPRIWSS